LALVQATKSTLRDSSATSSPRTIPCEAKIPVVTVSMKLVFGSLTDGMYITISNPLPFALCTVVSMISDSLLRSSYSSSPIAIKSKSPSRVGV